MIKGSVTPPFGEASSHDKVVFTCARLTPSLEPLHRRGFHVRQARPSLLSGSELCGGTRVRLKCALRDEQLSLRYLKTAASD